MGKKSEKPVAGAWKYDMAGVHKFVNLENPGQDITLVYADTIIRLKHGEERNVPRKFIDVCIKHAVAMDTLESTDINISEDERFTKIERPRYMAVPVSKSTQPKQVAREEAMVPSAPEEVKQDIINELEG